MSRQPIDLTKVKVFPLEQRASEAEINEILVNPDSTPPQCDARNVELIGDAVKRIRYARQRNSSVMLIYGAHLVKNGGASIVNRLIECGWITHIATNGAGIIHDWEFSFLGRSTESVRKNVATGTFGTWDETGRYINLAALVAGINNIGLGESLGKFISNDGTVLPSIEELENQVRNEPSNTLTAARAELAHAMRIHKLPIGKLDVKHRWKNASILATAYKNGVPFTVHPGIGYDIISNHPMFNGAAIGRAAQRDFQTFGAAVENLDGGVVMSVGSAIMGPQVFEKSISCVNNLRVQSGRPIVNGHTIYVVDLQDGGNWDWTKGEPPKDNPAYYLRFCKSFARMGGAMQYLQCDNVAFLHGVLKSLE